MKQSTIKSLNIINITIDFTKALKIPMMPDNLKRSIVIAALKSSFLQQE